MSNVAMKFRVKDEQHSKEIQEKLFSLGYKWYSGDDAQFTKQPFLYAADDEMLITYSDSYDEDYFNLEPHTLCVLLDGEFVPVDSVSEEVVQVSDSKVNPKQALGQASLPLNLFSPLATAYGSIGKLNGKLKYGLSNFVATPVIASIYADAIRRHLDKWMAGQEFDESDGVPHFAAMLANIDILLCARAAGTLVDDRPLLIGFEAEMEKLTPIVKALHELHKDKNPHHNLLSEKGNAK